MKRALLVKTDGSITEIEFEILQDLGYFTNDRNVDNYNVMEIHELGNKEYNVYGKLQGSRFNQYEFYTDNFMDEVFVYCSEGDVDKNEFLSYYNYTETLDDTLVVDEMDWKQDDVYMYDDFVVQDNGEGDMEMLSGDMIDYQDYLREHRD